MKIANCKSEMSILNNENVEHLFITQIKKNSFLTLPIKTNTCRILYLQNISAKPTGNNSHLKLRQ